MLYKMGDVNNFNTIRHALKAYERCQQPPMQTHVKSCMIDCVNFTSYALVNQGIKRLFYAQGPKV